jgi:dTDP-4-amino-4,6-dideoxygalactose transaminase
MLAAQRLAHRTLVWPSTTGPATRAFRWLTRRGAVIGSSAPAEFQPTMPAGFFMGMSPGQARAGRRHLRRLAGNLEHRRRLRRLYDDLLARSGWRVPELPAHMDPVLVRYPVRVADKAQAVAQAERSGVELGTWFECPLHPIETPLALYGYQVGSCPVSEQACREVVNLPTHLRASPRVAERSVALLRTIGPPPAGEGEQGQGQP